MLLLATVGAYSDVSLQFAMDAVTKRIDDPWIREDDHDHQPASEEQYEKSDPDPSLLETDGAPGLLLTWQRDPTTTMTIDWHATETQDATPALEFRIRDTEPWERRSGQPFEFYGTDRTIQRVELTGLEPNTEYAFRLPTDERTYLFRTMPETLEERSVQFASGGDTMHHWKYLARTNQIAMQRELDFVEWGGDLAYADGDVDHVDDWFDWFAVNKNTLITERNRVIPIVVGIGNHEIYGGSSLYAYSEYEQTDRHRALMAPYFYQLFAFPGQPGYGTLDFGEYLSLLMLDTDHSNPIHGTQREWLEKQLEERTDQSYVIPSYHVPGYPSHRDYEATTESRVREYWVPLFERFELDLALEHHDHTYKRTKPIKHGEVDPDGVQYVGDGAWGVNARAGDSKHEWYIEEFKSGRHAMIVSLEETEASLEVLAETGRPVDEFSIPSR